MKTPPAIRMARRWASLAAFTTCLLSTTDAVFGFAGGDGSADAPYQVATAADLSDVRNHLGAHFVQTSDIDLGDPAWSSGVGWLPIGKALTGPLNRLGGIAGSANSSRIQVAVHYCYWDTERSGQTTSAMGEGKTTPEIRQAESFPTYHFGRIWTIEEGVSDPVLVDFVALSPYEPALVMPANLPGAGTPESPYQIATAAELHAMRHDLAAHYRLVADIDLTDSVLWDAGRGWNPVGYSRVGTTTGRQAFSGSLDGGGHNIAHLAINRPVLEVAGLFGYAEGAKIRNLQVTDTVARTGRHSGIITGNTIIGGFSGVIYSPGVALDSFSRAKVTGADRVGGFAGDMWSGGLRAALCYSAGAVVGDGTWVGGFVAYPANSPVVSFCYWDTQASGIATDPLAASRMTAEMTHPHASNTNPNNPQSRFVTDTPVRAGTAVEIHFQPSSPDRRYMLWRSADLADWTPVPGQINVPGGNGPLVDDTPPGGNAFYRVAASLP